MDPSDIDTSYMDLQIKARERFLSDFASIVYKRNMQGNVAEAGVFQGEFAKVINCNFPDKSCICLILLGDLMIGILPMKKGIVFQLSRADI